MPDKPRYTPAMLADALLKADGIKTVAAQRLGCNTMTIDRGIARYPTVAAAYEQAREGICDVAESVVVKHLQANSLEAAKYVLSRMGKERGWGDSIDVTHKLEDIARQIADETGEPFEVVLPRVTDLASERRKRKAA